MRVPRAHLAMDGLDVRALHSLFLDLSSEQAAQI
jgi:hypothetical protein